VNPQVRGVESTPGGGPGNWKFMLLQHRGYSQHKGPVPRLQLRYPRKKFLQNDTRSLILQSTEIAQSGRLDEPKSY